MHEVIFEADTAAGRTFDVLLLWCIVLSVLAVLLESVAAVKERFAFSICGASTRTGPMRWYSDPVCASVSSLPRAWKIGPT